MPKKGKLYVKLFLSTFQLSAFTFGGGYVIVPLMRKKFVEQLGWLQEQEMLDLTAIAQAAPGVIAVNASILIGYRVAGVAGALVTVFGTVLPPLLTLSVISLFYAAFRDNRIVNLVLLGMQAGIAAVICDVVLRMGHTVLKDRRWLPAALLAGAFLAALLDVHLLIILLICGAIGGFDRYRRNRREQEER